MLRPTMTEVKASHSLGAPLENKVVLVTGASSGIGRAIASACARAGADIATTFHTSQANAEAVAAEARSRGRRALVIRCDVARQEDLDQLAAQVRREFGRVDAWINNAGVDILTGQASRLTRIEKLDRLIAVDLRGTMLASWTAAEIMKGQPGGGTIINMSWDGVLQGLEGENPQLFAAVKGGVASFSRSLARSLAPRIRVNVLGPGWIETAFGESVDAAFKRRISEKIPLKRWGTPEDVAGVAVFLASDAAGYLTGQTITINGGEVM